eukprot:m.51259 g.51259  ORF g.51259 m.51259 type:complete len:315 (+) comp10722_c0_seq2:220-1164(+)
MHQFPHIYVENEGFGLAANQTGCNIPHRYLWVYSVFGECVVDNLQFVGFCLGMLSNVCWLLAQGPQLWKNFVQGKAEGLSIYFLADWLLGDITNLIGCLYADQVATQLFTAIYFCFIDSLMVLQWVFYYNKNSDKSASVAVNSWLLPLIIIAAPSFIMSTMMQGDDMNSYVPRGHGRMLLEAPKVTAVDTTRGLVGYILGWVSGMLYFTSRIPQILKNFKRKTCEGLSPIMFSMAVLGNVLYAAGVLMISVDPTFILNHLPWLIGSIGTLFFDFTILVQYFIYGEESEGAVGGSRRKKKGKGEYLIGSEYDTLL